MVTGSEYFKVSIPQAVSTVATVTLDDAWPNNNRLGFNTASGKYCCNQLQYSPCLNQIQLVSIPQAVSTVATEIILE